MRLVYASKLVILWRCTVWFLFGFETRSRRIQYYVLQVQPTNELTIADDRYKDANYFIYPSGNPETVVEQKSIMSRHETINKRLKVFNDVLNTAFRHK